MSTNGSGKAGHPHAKPQPAADNHVETETWHAAGRKEDGTATMGNSLAVPQKVRHRITI